MIAVPRPSAVVTLGIFCCLLVAPGAAGKEGVRAQLEAPVPEKTQPGQIVTIAWSLFYKEGGERRPFGAGGLFVRLLSASGGKPTKAHGDGQTGRYVAEVMVPEGGIGGIEFGLEGTRYVGGAPGTGRAEDADVTFPLVNDPFEQETDAPATSSTGGAADSDGAATWLVIVGALGAGGVAITLLRNVSFRRRRSAGGA